MLKLCDNLPQIVYRELVQNEFVASIGTSVQVTVVWLVVVGQLPQFDVFNYVKRGKPANFELRDAYCNKQGI